LKSLIDIGLHNKKLLIKSNTFEDNTSTKGLILLESIDEPKKNPRSEAMLLMDNTFIRNSAIIDANVINFRKSANPERSATHDHVFAEKYEAITDPGLVCGGFSMKNNTIEDSIGCPYANGAAMIYCFDVIGDDDQVTYQPRVDSQYFSSFDAFEKESTLIDQKPYKVVNDAK
jgi:hypothetical protein